MNRVIRHLRDEKREYIEKTKGVHGGPCFKENFQWNWSNVRYDRYVAEAQDMYDRIFYFYDHGAQITSSTTRSSLNKPCPSGTLWCKHGPS
jgi:hypothetical protein